MNYFPGRDNLALTIFVPYNCANACPFCTSKADYKAHPPKISKVKDQIRDIFKNYSYPIRDVVITGGEPMMQMGILGEIIDLIPEDLNVYINTTFIKTNLDKFIDMINTNSKIQGVNISRHYGSYDKDCNLMCNIAPDDEIDRIEKPVRINCVLSGEKNYKLIEDVIARWNFHDVEVSFRRDYTTVKTNTELHNPFDWLPMYLNELGFNYAQNTRCNVCDTTVFRKGRTVVRYHKGIQNTAIQHDHNNIEFNDLIVFQNGDFSYDWARKDTSGIEDNYRIYSEDIHYSEPMGYTPYACGDISYGCGSSGYGIIRGCGSGGCGNTFTGGCG